jgi:hypothetical protein
LHSFISARPGSGSRDCRCAIEHWKWNAGPDTTNPTVAVVVAESRSLLRPGFGSGAGGWRFGLSSLGSRDEHANDLTNALDFSH